MLQFRRGFCLELQLDLVKTEHGRRPIANTSGSDRSGDLITVLFIRARVLKETIATDNGPVRQRCDTCALTLGGLNQAEYFPLASIQ